MMDLDIMYYVGDKVVNDVSHLDDYNVLVPKDTIGRVLATKTNDDLSLSVIVVWFDVPGYPFETKTTRYSALVSPKPRDL